jgi:hypothetical protein
MATHTYSVLLAPSTVTAGGTQTSSAADLTGAYGGIVTAQIANGATGPSVPCVASVQVSGDNTNFYTMFAGTEDVTNSATTNFTWDIPPGAMYVRVQFTGNAGQSVTASAQIQILSTI